jgi:3-methyladenine DNA glycosylase AlkD
MKIKEFDNEFSSLKDEVNEMWMEKEIDSKVIQQELSFFANQIKNGGVGEQIKKELETPSLKPIKKTKIQKFKEWFKNLKKKFDGFLTYTDDEIDFFGK